MEDFLNHTTPQVSPSPHTEDQHRYFTVIPVLLITLAACALAVVLYFKRKLRVDELRHRLIPQYIYDPTEQDQDDVEYESGDEDEQLKEPLHKYGRLSLDSDYGTEK